MSHDAAGRQPVDVIVSADAVLTMDDADRVVRGGAVAVRGDRIVAVGTAEDIERAYAAATRLGGRHKIVMPGLVDAYGHAGHGMIKAIHNAHLGWPGNEVYFHATTPAWWEADALLTGVERVKFGVTTGQSVLGATPARADDPVYAEAHVRGVTAVGTRDVVGMGPPDPFLPHLPRPWSATDWRSGRAEVHEFSYDQCMAVSAHVAETFHGAADGRIHVCLAIPYLCGMSPRTTAGKHHYPYSPDDLRELERRGLEAQAFAARHGVSIHTHAARGTFEHLERALGRDAVRQLLGPNVVIAHGHGLTLADIDLLQESGPAVAWVPFGTWGTRVGPAPIIELLRAGIRCCIATDGAAPFHVSDLFLGIHRARYLINQHYHDVTLLPPGRALRMVTIEAAAVLGLAEDIGSLEVGKKADLIVIDADQPHLTPMAMPAQLVSYFARGNDVETVLVDGKILMRDRVVQSVREADVLQRAREEQEASFGRVDIARYTAMTRDFWRGWRY